MWRRMALGGTARRPGTRLDAARSHENDTQATLVRPALWALSGRDEAGDQSATRFRMTLPAPATGVEPDENALSVEDAAVWGDQGDEDSGSAWRDRRDHQQPAHTLEFDGRGHKWPAHTMTTRLKPLGGLSLPKQRGIWAVCATLLLITLSGLAFAAFPIGKSHPGAHTASANATGLGAVTDDPQSGALALGQKGAAQVIAQTSPVATGTGAPCDGPVQFPAKIDTWTVPAGCYGLIYTPNPANYPSRPGFGYCNWWVRVMDLKHPDITENTSYPHGSVPRVGAAVYFDGGVQGADPAGHWARVEAIAPDGYWMLVSEMNFTWRGGGFGKVDYRFAHTGPGVTFIYA